MLSTRWLGAASARAALGGGLAACAVCRGWGAPRLCGACVARFAAPLPRCERCALEVPAGVATLRRLPARPAAVRRDTLAAVDYGYPWDG